MFVMQARNVLIVPAILRSMFLRCYATSLQRPWLKSPESAFNDARYRLSIPLAAPVVVLMAMSVLIARNLNPSLLSARAAALVVCFSLIAAGVGAYVLLGRIFASYSGSPELASKFDQPLSGTEIAVQFLLWVCVAAYCVMMIYL